jgi:1-aminocyclopropane-1-carboxylate deaminase/D-cysteine desulfhydrase-like pyridoxal-dependent ACC family enzyme
VSVWTARLDAMPRLSLVSEPTPLASAPHLSAALGGPQLWFKRDDLFPVAFGGNKVRALDLIVAEALRQGAELLSDGLYADAETALFLHTGGTPSLFTAAVEGMS